MFYRRRFDAIRALLPALLVGCGSTGLNFIESTPPSQSFGCRRRVAVVAIRFIDGTVLVAGRFLS
jgi:hypothetical protein